MSLTEQIIEIVEHGRALGLFDVELDHDQMLYAMGCIRVLHRSDTLIVYYYDQDGQERFVICALTEFSDAEGRELWPETGSNRQGHRISSGVRAEVTASFAANIDDV
jgi:hypothetical protein